VRIGLMADSHENMPMIKRAVDLFNRECAGLVLHAGDIISPITAKEFARLEMRMIAVFGNNDGDRPFLEKRFAPFADIHPGAWGFEAGGRRMLLMHAPDALEAIEASGAYDAIVYGHTHEAVVRRTGRTLVVNPGECGGWITGRSTVALLETGTMEAEIRTL
jgi:putative phosphoesterase